MRTFVRFAGRNWNVFDVLGGLEVERYQAFTHKTGVNAPLARPPGPLVDMSPSRVRAGLPPVSSLQTWKKPDANGITTLLFAASTYPSTHTEVGSIPLYAAVVKW